jgi:phage terminase large subunit-like protein
MNSPEINIESVYKPLFKIFNGEFKHTYDEDGMIVYQPLGVFENRAEARDNIDESTLEVGDYYKLKSTRLADWWDGEKWNRNYPPPETRYVILTGGRGSGKSFGLGTWAKLATYREGTHILFTRYTMDSAKDSIIHEFVEKIDLLKTNDKFKVTNKDVLNEEHNSSIKFRGIKTSSGNQTAKLKSLNGISIWILDEAEELADEETFDKINQSIRLKTHKNLTVLSLNPTHVNHWIFKKFFTKDGKPKRDDTLYIHTDYRDNLKNLNQAYINDAETLKANNLKKYKHQFLGEWQNDTEGALWRDEIISPYRVHIDDVPNIRRMVVAVDPAVTNKDTSDETGIIVCGVGIDNHFYVFDDYTLKGSPIDWGRKSICAFDDWEADVIIGEVNQGGDLVERNLRTIRKAVSYDDVRASRGKITRAEPISSLYEQELVHHVIDPERKGHLTELEFEMTTYTGKDNEVSPNRYDALVWGLTKLSEGRDSILNAL